jgi:hypothetical protein
MFLFSSQVMEYGEVDFSRLLEEQKGKRLNMNFVGLFWLQVRLIFSSLALCRRRFRNI